MDALRSQRIRKQSLFLRNSLRQTIKGQKTNNPSSQTNSQSKLETSINKFRLTDNTSISKIAKDWTTTQSILQERTRVVKSRKND